MRQGANGASGAGLQRCLSLVGCGALLVGVALAGQAMARAPDSSIRPLPRPSQTAPAVLPPGPSETAAPGAVVEPAPPMIFAHPDPTFAAVGAPLTRRATDAGGWQDVSDPGGRPRARVDAAAAVPAPGLGARLIAALRPEPRPAALARRAAPTPAPQVAEPVAAVRPAPGTGPVTSRRGSVCGVASIKGETIAPIVGRVRGCGVANPVRITSVEGVRLSQPAIMDCDTARAVQTWVRNGVQPAFRGQVTTLQVAGHYVCRTRNHRKGARLSEHAKGKAIDISGLTLADGTKLTIQRDWRGRHGKALKSMHKAACGTFGTTLGPGSDGMHEDHLHLDTARHRNGPYCR